MDDMPNPNVEAYERLRAMSAPITLDPSREHKLYLASWRVQDGGVVNMRYQAFCSCYWSERYPSSNSSESRQEYQEHLDV